MPVTAASPPPPKNTRTSGKPQATPPVSKYTERREGLEGYAGLAQAALIGFHQYADAGAIGQHFPQVASEIAKLADADERIAGVIDPLIQAGPYTALLTAVLPLIMQIAVNHGRMKPGALGTMPKEAMAARIETGIAKMQLEALRQQRAMEEETERIQTELRNARTVVPGRVTHT